MSVLHLTLKKKWFDMIASGEKNEEYRELKDYWCNRFCVKDWHRFYLEYFEKAINLYPDVVLFRNGYGKNAPEILIECRGITIGKARPEWSDNYTDHVFIIKLGKIIHHKSNK